MAKNEGEKDWDYFGRLLPEVYEAFHRIPGLGNATKALFDTPKTVWDGNNQVDLTDKLLCALLQAEVEEIAARLQEVVARVQNVEESREGLSARTGWRLLLRSKTALLYQSTLGDVAEVPLELADVLVKRDAFEGEVKPHEKYLRFVVGEDTLADLPRSLVLQLRGSEPVEENEKSEDDRGEVGE